MDIKELQKIMQENGVVGAGGAGFPTYMKLTDKAEIFISGNTTGHHIFPRILFAKAGCKRSYLGGNGYIQTVDDICNILILGNQGNHLGLCKYSTHA